MAEAMRHRSVSSPRSSNRTCGFPASGSPTGFTSRRARLRLTAPPPETLTSTDKGVPSTSEAGAPPPPTSRRSLQRVATWGSLFGSGDWRRRLPARGLGLAPRHGLGLAIPARVGVQRCLAVGTQRLFRVGRRAGDEGVGGLRGAGALAESGIEKIDHGRHSSGSVWPECPRSRAAGPTVDNTKRGKGAASVIFKDGALIKCSRKIYPIWRPIGTVWR